MAPYWVSPDLTLLPSQGGSIWFTEHPPVEGRPYFNFNADEWQDVKPISKAGYIQEKQFKSGIYVKSNYTELTPDYWELLREFKVAFWDFPYKIATLSRNLEGKLSAYTGQGLDSQLDKFNVPKGHYWSCYSLSIDLDGARSLKVYDLDHQLGSLPELVRTEHAYSGTFEIPPGVAKTYTTSNQLPLLERYFSAEPEDVQSLCAQLGLTYLPPDEPVHYYGLVYLENTSTGITALDLKYLNWSKAASEKVETAWTGGDILRVGYTVDSYEGNKLYNYLPMLCRYGRHRLSNIGVNDYENQLGYTSTVISCYYNGEAPDELLDLAGVPSDVLPMPWFGIKHCLKTRRSWLKLADSRVSNYDTPAFPDGVRQGFGVATTYPLGSHAEVHNGLGSGWMDCSFFPKDHKAVRKLLNNLHIADPNPALPDTLEEYGVYSITYRGSEILRVKFYEYHNKQFVDMKNYLATQEV